MEVASNKAQRAVLSLAVFTSAALLVGGLVFFSRDFGLGAVSILSLLLVPPLVTAVRLRRRWPAVRSRELAFLVVLLCAAAGSSAFVLRAWYVAGLDRYHAEDVRWAEFERRLRRDPAFRDIQIHKTERHNIHWASGEVDSEAELARLQSLAVECGIEQQRLDGPYQSSHTLDVRGRSGD